MIIAILGWGSLIWDPRSLQIDINQGKERWLEHGPLLPIEFARISNDGRLTLVIMPNEYDVTQTLYAFSEFELLDEAILDLAVREGCGKNKIGFYKKNEQQFSDNFLSNNFQKQRQTILEWLNNNSIDAVIWTNLAPNYKDKFNLDEFTPLDAVKYLMYLPSDIQAKAEEYIRKAPGIINTPIRKKIEEELNWKRITT